LSRAEEQLVAEIMEVGGYPSVSAILRHGLRLVARECSVEDDSLTEAVIERLAGKGRRRKRNLPSPGQGINPEV
jgi:hypothetical protein